MAAAVLARLARPLGQAAGRRVPAAAWKCARPIQGRLLPPRPVAAVAFQLRVRCLSTSSVTNSGAGHDEDTLLDRLARGVGWASGFYGRKQVLHRSAQSLYDSCTVPALHPQLYRLCSLEDTFQSWFLVVHLHMWMCLCRLKAEGKEGSVVYKQVVRLFWHDVDHRMKSMGVNDSSIVKESTRELVDMFYGLTFAYDEGITSDDTVLATALWRNLCTRQRDDIAALESLVEYVRREVHRLDSADAETLLTKGQHTFGKLPSVVPLER